ncbi:MAG: alpha/beta hydrolase [Puniceicoccales bacterium]|jgi:fermentation-respiration switch protein FrsA (DUF1100 family)|nr:alpha/beta hydrolase [Puniceicoccales bacterium]
MAKKKKAKSSRQEKVPEQTKTRLQRYRGWALRFLASIGLIYAGLVVFGCTFSNAIIFPVPKPYYSADEPHLVTLPLQGGGEIPALWLENPQAKWTILYFHGNGMDLGDCRSMLKETQAQGYSVLAVDYPGYGIAKGKPTEEGCYLAADAAYSYLRTTKGIPANRLALHGMSLGTGVAVDLASRQPVGALILEAPYLSTFRVVTRVKLVPFDRFDSYAKIEKITCPLLVIHGTADSVIPYWHGEKLFAAAINSPRKQFHPVQGGNHVNLRQIEGKKYWESIARILAASE